MAPKTMKRPAAADAKAVSMKRPAATIDSRVAKKPAKAVEKTEHDAVVQKCKVIEQTLQEHAGLPTIVRTMLCSHLVNTIGVPQQDRHHVQEQVAEWVHEAMAGIKETLDAQIDAHDAKLAAADGEKASLEAGMADACADHGAKSDDLIGKKKSLAELTTAEASAANVLRNAEVNLADCDSELVKAAEQKKRMEEMMAEAFAKLKVGEDRAQLKGFLKTAAEYLKQTEVSAELFAAAVSKAPSDRGTFDNIIISTVEEDIKKLIDKCGEIIASGETTKHDRTMTVEAARSALTEALKAKEVAKEECQVALNAEKESSDVLKRAKQALKKFGPSMKALAGEMKVLKSRRKHFVEGPLACLTSLQAVESARNDAELEEGEALAAGNKALAEAAAPEAEAAVPEVGAAMEAVSEIPLQEQQHAETA